MTYQHIQVQRATKTLAPISRGSTSTTLKTMRSTQRFNALYTNSV